MRGNFDDEENEDEEEDKEIEEKKSQIKLNRSTVTDKERTRAKNAVELTQIATSMSPAFILPDGSTVNFEQAFVWLCNEVSQIRRSL